MSFPPSKIRPPGVSRLPIPKTPSIPTSSHSSSIPRPTSSAFRSRAGQAGVVARTSFLSPKERWTDARKTQSGPRYQLKDPGVTPSSGQGKLRMKPLRIIPKQLPSPALAQDDTGNITLDTATPPIRTSTSGITKAKPAPDPPAPANVSGSERDVPSKQDENPSLPESPLSNPTPRQQCQPDYSPSADSTIPSRRSSHASTISSYSSASALARARASERGPCVLSEDDSQPVTLEWEPDPEGEIEDEAEKVWRRLETKMGRSFGSNLGCDRGRWVMTAQRRHLPFDAEVGKSNSKSILKMEGNAVSMAEVELDDSIEMERQASEFSVSAYLDFTEEDEAIFDMSKPLVRSASKTASTPFNTPCIHRETIHRSGRVSRRKATIPLTGFSTDSSSSSSSSSTGSMPPQMCRLDSQVVAALVALESTLFTPELDYALGLGEDLTPIPAPAQNANVPVRAYDEMTRHLDLGRGLGLGLGLGLDMDIQNDTIYHLPVRSRLARPTESVRRDGVATMSSLRKQVRDDSDMLRITDLDTGVSRNVHVASLEAE